MNNIVIHHFKKNLYKYLVANFIYIGIVVGVLYTIPNIYMSEYKLLFEDPEQNYNQISGSSSSLANLSGLTGFGFGAKNDKSIILIEKVKSQIFLNKFAKENDVVPILFAFDKVLNDGTIAFDEKKFDVKSKKFVMKFKNDSHYPSDEEIYKEISKLVTITKNQDTGIISIRFLHYIPEEALRLNVKFLKYVNETQRSIDRENIRVNIEYLTNQLESESNADVKTSLIGLLLANKKKMMAVDLKNQYTLSVIDGPTLPVDKFSPKRLLILVTSIFLFFVMQIFSVFLWKIRCSKSY